MKRTPLVFALLLVAIVARADPPTATGSASAPAPTAAPSLGWPTEASPKPKEEEWTSAAILPLLRPEENCTTLRLREWLRVTCRGDLFKGIRIVGGATDEVEIGDPGVVPGGQPVDEFGIRNPHGIRVTFPVRRGDRRILEVVGNVFEGRYTVGEDAAAIVSVLWLPGDAGPTIVID